jgi:hypothetical protein
MNKAPSRVILAAFALVAIVAMVMLNSFIQRNNPEEQEKQAQEAAQKAAAVGAQKATPAPMASHIRPAPAADLSTLGEDAVIGRGTGPEVTVRWSWTPAVQAEPNKVYAVVTALQKAAPGIRLHLVNADETPEEPLGVFVDGREIAPAAADGGITVDPAVILKLAGTSGK